MFDSISNNMTGAENGSQNSAILLPQQTVEVVYGFVLIAPKTWTAERIRMKKALVFDSRKDPNEEDVGV